MLPVMQVVHVVDILVVAQRLLHKVQPVLRTIKIPQLLVDTVIDIPVVQVVQSPQIDRSHPCRGAEAVSKWSCGP